MGSVPRALEVATLSYVGDDVSRGGRHRSSTTQSRVRCARCVPATSTGGHRFAAKLHVSGPTGEEATAPSQGGSAGSNPVGATNGYQYNTAADLEKRGSGAVLCVRPGPAVGGHVCPIRARVPLSDVGLTAWRGLAWPDTATDLVPMTTSRSEAFIWVRPGSSGLPTPGTAFHWSCAAPPGS